MNARKTVYAKKYRPTKNELADTTGILGTYVNEIDLYNEIEFIMENMKNPINYVIDCEDLSLDEKNKIIDIMFLFIDTKECKYHGISPLTMTKLLKIKEETITYLDFYSKIIKFAKEKNIEIFLYEHLYRLVLQIWNEHPKIISTNFRKKLIYIAFDNKLPPHILNKIKNDIGSWFINLDDKYINEMLEWLCRFDTTNELQRSKIIFEKLLEENSDDEKEFKKINNMTKSEYLLQQQKAKNKGLCKYIRENTICPHGAKCLFYHGKLEETYGFQMCKYGDKCGLFRKGECKFIHKPNKQQIHEINSFYKKMGKCDNGYIVPKFKCKKIDFECLVNPYIILQKEKTKSHHTIDPLLGDRDCINDDVVYTIPKCPVIVNNFGIEQKCDKSVFFMTVKNGKISNFYCCYEHMVLNEPDSSYVVKQNFLEALKIL